MEEKWKMRILSQIHTADPVGMGRKLCPVEYAGILIYWRDFLPIQTGPTLCFRRNILVVHFASYSIYNLLFYGLKCTGIPYSTCRRYTSMRVGNNRYKL